MVVTIVVLLILAGVSISLLLDQNGIIKKSKDARREYGQAKANEQEDLSNLSDMIDEATAEPTPKVDVNTKAGDNSTINGKKGTSNNPTIPAGYIPINTDTSSWGDGTSAPSQDSIDHGLVIKDDSDNEWVWIPVPDVTVMCDTSNETEYTLCGTEGDTAVKTKLYSKSEIISGKTRTTPGTTDYREPDLVVERNSTSYDDRDTYYKKILGENGTKEELAQLFVDEYKEMIESIKKYGGFYIGRYELSKAGVQKNQPTLTYRDWYGLYNACKDTKLHASDKVKTGMIWGCQWDVTMNWLISSGAKTSDEVNEDSSSWGNYSSTSVKANDGTTEIKASGKIAVLNTGVTTYTMANNIYDLAGNCFEWTQEANGSCRANRGGSCNAGGAPSSNYRGYNTHPDSSTLSYRRYSSNFNNKVG
ncbi:MAG: hypothetical protein ACLS3W_06145 [Clostridia bacterium]